MHSVDKLEFCVSEGILNKLWKDNLLRILPLGFLKWEKDHDFLK